MQDSASFWTDIKNLEEQLAKSPGSFCFARLSEVYLKVGLVDDALHVARQGVMRHPGYLSGQRALSLACLAKGLNDEALAALKLVTEAFPEDLSSQKLLGRIYVEAGNQTAAGQAFRTALEFAPDDVECRIELESLARSTGGSASAFESEDDEEIIEDLEILDELEAPEVGQPASEFEFQEEPYTPDVAVAPLHDPLSTVTLAELYVTQGFIHKALEIYLAILADNPSDQVIAGRVTELEALESGSEKVVSEADYVFEGDIDEGPDSGIEETFFQETESVQSLESGDTQTLEKPQASGDVFLQESVPVVPPEGIADNALATLDVWLENIRRIKSCR